MAGNVAVKIEPKPALRKRQAVCMELVAPGEWRVCVLAIEGLNVVGEVQAGKAYYRDLAEQAAAKAMRRIAR